MRLQWMMVCLAMAFSAAAQDAHLAGTWKGWAEKTVCGKPAGGEQVTLYLENKGYSPVPNWKPFGDVSGYMLFGETPQGTVVLKYDSKTAKAASFLGSVNLQTGLGMDNKAFSTYWFDLQAGDAWRGMGYFQTLNGTIAQRNWACGNLGGRGEVLTVKLKKQ